MNDPSRHIQNVALIGFMGTGKTSTGHQLAMLLDYGFVDTDSLIEEQAGKTVTQIFAQFGEPAFRDLETRVGRMLAARQKLVIATGGGFVLNPIHLDELKCHALVICLWASPETIYERVRNQSHRPLLQEKDPLGTIRSLMAQRESAYRKADVLINTEQRSIRELAQQIAHQFHAIQS